MCYQTKRVGVEYITSQAYVFMTGQNRILTELK